MNWINVKDRLPEYDQENQKAFYILMRAMNERYYTGYSVTEYGETTFHQYNGRRVLNVTHWMHLSELPNPNQNNNDMKIFEIQTGGETEWMFAISAIQALKEYCDITGYSIHDFDDEDEINEVPKDKWSELKITFPDDSEQEPMTFEEYVKEIKAPHYMFSTVY